jgi:spermidine/putrescine transport system permease protein
MGLFSRAYKTTVALPPLLWVMLCLVVPYAILFVHSFFSVTDGVIVHRFALANYAKLLETPLYLEVLWASVKIALAVTLLALCLAYPLAYYLSFHARHKNLLYQLVIIPLWVSYLVRAYAWKTILGSAGVMNRLLMDLHLTSQPVEFLLYSPFAVVVTLVHIYTPFAFLPIYAALEHIPRPLVEASQDLGAGARETFRRVILPLSLPGVIAGSTFAFVLSLGDFLAPLLVGGAAYDWPLGAAISLCMLLLVVSLLSLTERLEKRWSFS